MKIEIKDEGLTELSNYSFKDGNGVRLTLKEIPGACSVGIELEMSINKKQEDDVEINEHGISFYVPNTLLAQLPNKIYLNFVSGKGFKISSNEETLGYRIQLKSAH